MEIHWGYTMDNNEHSVGSEVPMYKLKQVVSSTLWFFFQEQVLFSGGFKGALEMMAPLDEFICLIFIVSCNDQK